MVRQLCIIGFGISGMSCLSWAKKLNIDAALFLKVIVYLVDVGTVLVMTRQNYKHLKNLIVLVILKCLKLIVNILTEMKF